MDDRSVGVLHLDPLVEVDLPGPGIRRDQGPRLHQRLAACFLQPRKLAADLIGYQVFRIAEVEKEQWYSLILCTAPTTTKPINMDQVV